jgi:predicted XRE-type DNA-binding protein
MHTDPFLDLKQSAGAALARRIEGWASAHDAAAFLGTDRARVADIRRGALKRFSFEMLLRLLVRAGAGVEIRLTVPRRGAPRASFIDEAKP